MEEHGQTKIASYAQNMESVNLQKGNKVATMEQDAFVMDVMQEYVKNLFVVGLGVTMN